MAKKYDKEFMTTGKEVNEIADSLRNKNNRSNDEKKKGKKKLIILLLLLLMFVVAGVVVAVMVLSTSNLEVGFYVKNVDAGVKIWGQVVDANNTSSVDILVDNKQYEYLSFMPEDSVDGELHRDLKFSTSAVINQSSIIQFFYEIENRSPHADMYVDVAKTKATDNNFEIGVYYKVGNGPESNVLTYYAVNGKYYMSIYDAREGINGLDEVSLTEAIKVPKESKMTMRIEVKVTDANKEANCNCNFIIKLINELLYTSGK